MDFSTEFDFDYFDVVLFINLKTFGFGFQFTSGQEIELGYFSPGDKVQIRPELHLMLGPIDVHIQFGQQKVTEDVS